jgi:hypothetical protein
MAGLFMGVSDDRVAMDPSDLEGMWGRPSCARCELLTPKAYRGDLAAAIQELTDIGIQRYLLGLVLFDCFICFYIRIGLNLESRRDFPISATELNH